MDIPSDINEVENVDRVGVGRVPLSGSQFGSKPPKIDVRTKHGQIISASLSPDRCMRRTTADPSRKYEFARKFGVINSASANGVWIPEVGPSTSARSTGGGQAIVAANEEVLCWDIKKGDLLSRWRDLDCQSLVTVIAQSETDVDLFAVG